MAATEAQKRATNNYRKKFDQVAAYLPLGAVEYLKNKGFAVSPFLNDLLEEHARRAGWNDYPTRDRQKESPPVVDASPGRQVSRRHQTEKGGGLDEFL